MKKNIIYALTVAWLLLLSSSVLAMTAASTSSYKKSNSNHSNGLFGGIRPDGTFVFMFAEDKGVRFYRVNPGVMINYKGFYQSLNKLPIKTPVRIDTENGRISVIEILEVQP